MSDVPRRGTLVNEKGLKVQNVVPTRKRGTEGVFKDGQEVLTLIFGGGKCRTWSCLSVRGKEKRFTCQELMS